MHEVTYDRQLKNDPFVTIAQTDLIYSLWNTLFQSCSVFFFCVQCLLWNICVNIDKAGLTGPLYDACSSCVAGSCSHKTQVGMACKRVKLPGTVSSIERDFPND